MGRFMLALWLVRGRGWDGKWKFLVLERTYPGELGCGRWGVGGTHLRGMGAGLRDFLWGNLPSSWLLKWGGSLR